LSATAKPRRSAVSRHERRCLAPGLVFAQPDPRQRRVGEHTIGDQAAAGSAIAANQILADDAEVVGRHMGELWTAGALANRPDVGRARFEPVVDRDISPYVERDTGELEPDPFGIGDAPGRDQVAAFDGLIA